MLKVDQQISFGEWLELGKEIKLRYDQHGKARDSTKWELGDWAAGSDRTVRQAADDIGIEYESLKVYKWVADSYEPVTRVTDLSFRHHQVLAAYPKDEDIKQRAAWIAEAVENRWSVRVMLEAIKEYNKPPPPPEPPKDRVKDIEEVIIADDADPVEAIQQNVDEFGPLTPADAKELAKEYDLEIGASDGFTYDSVPQEIREREHAAAEQRWRIYTALNNLATVGLAREEAYAIPDYERDQIEEFLETSFKWLNEFKYAWEERWRKP